MCSRLAIHFEGTVVFARSCRATASLNGAALGSSGNVRSSNPASRKAACTNLSAFSSPLSRRVLPG